MEVLDLSKKNISSMSTQACKKRLREIDAMCEVLKNEIYGSINPCRASINHFLDLQEERRMVGIQLSLQLDPYNRKGIQ